MDDSLFNKFFLYLEICYRKIRRINKKKIKVLHIIGGGSSNALLNQFTANTLGIPIKLGPVEATAIGNI